MGVFSKSKSLPTNGGSGLRRALFLSRYSYAALCAASLFAVYSFIVFVAVNFFSFEHLEEFGDLLPVHRKNAVVVEIEERAVVHAVGLKPVA